MYIIIRKSLIMEFWKKEHFVSTKTKKEIKNSFNMSQVLITMAEYYFQKAIKRKIHEQYFIWLCIQLIDYNCLLCIN